MKNIHQNFFRFFGHVPHFPTVRNTRLDEHLRQFDVILNKLFCLLCSLVLFLRCFLIKLTSKHTFVITIKIIHNTRFIYLNNTFMRNLINFCTKDRVIFFWEVCFELVFMYQENISRSYIQKFFCYMFKNFIHKIKFFDMYDGETADSN